MTDRPWKSQEAKIRNPARDYEKRYLDSVRGERCIICKLDFASHEWMPPAGQLARGTKDMWGHDFTPLHGKPIRHPRFVSPPNVHDR